MFRSTVSLCGGEGREGHGLRQRGWEKCVYISAVRGSKIDHTGSGMGSLTCAEGDVWFGDWITSCTIV